MNNPISLRALFADMLSANAKPTCKMTYRRGPHGERVSVLGYGAMRLPMIGDKDEIDRDLLARQVDMMISGGVNFFDTSAAYCKGRSESALGEALSRYPRSSYYLSTKLSNFAESQYPFEESKKLFLNSLKFLRTDYVDFYLLHAVGMGGMAAFRKRYVDNGIIPWLFAQKRKGAIRNLGFSYHGDEEAYRWLLQKHDEGVYKWDFALIQMNYVDWRHAKEVNSRNLNAEMLYRELTERGIKIMVMEPLLGGRLARHNDAVDAELMPLDREATPAKWALRFCASHSNVMTVLSGMTFNEHIAENIATMSPLKKLSAGEFTALERAARAYLGYGAIPCNSCNYCMPCPYGLDIPTSLVFMNRMRTERINDPKVIRAEYEKAIPDPRRRADRCIDCSRCMSHCPQGIDISRLMDEIAAFTEVR